MWCEAILSLFLVEEASELICTVAAAECHFSQHVGYKWVELVFQDYLLNATL